MCCHFVSRRIAIAAIVSVSAAVAVGFRPGDSGDWENLHLANYVQPDDLPSLRKLGINTVLMEFDKKPNDWREVYDAVISNDMRVVPILWGKHQSIWKWNSSDAEWELDAKRYPRSHGARFIKFLLENDDCREHTLAVYSFHEPWYATDKDKGKRKGTVTPSRQRKFWQQIRELFDGDMKVYGEEVSWVSECRNGCADYDYVTLYSFANCNGGVAYRPGGRFLTDDGHIDGSQAPCETDQAKALEQERSQIALMHGAIQDAAAAPDGSRTKLIALMGTFAHDEEADLWNRMPTVDEMQLWVTDIIRPSKTRLAGLGWYCFRNPTDYYHSFLQKDREDSDGKDRWRAVADAHSSLIDE